MFRISENVSSTTKEDIDKKLIAAEQRRSQNVEELKNRLAEHDKHAEEVREKSKSGNTNGSANGTGENGTASNGKA